MKKYIPIILPILALALVTYFGVRWYRHREAPELQTPEVANSPSIAPINVADQQLLAQLRAGKGDYEAVGLQAQTSDARGEIRYQFQNDRLLFSVNANLPSDEGEEYHVFVKEAGSEVFRDLGVLEFTKGGLIASDSLTMDKLPMVVEIRRGATVVLTGVITAPSVTDQTASNESETENSPLDNQADQE